MTPAQPDRLADALRQLAADDATPPTVREWLLALAGDPTPVPANGYWDAFAGPRPGPKRAPSDDEPDDDDPERTPLE